MPAAARIVEELAPDNEAIAIVEVAEEADLEYLPHRTNVTVIATVGTGNGDGESVLAQLVAAQPLPCGWGYCWFAGEAGQSRAVRKYLRGQHHWDAEQFDILGYWRRDSEAWERGTPRSRLISCGSREGAREEREALWISAIASSENRVSARPAILQ